MFGSVGGSGFDSDCEQAGASRAEQFWCGFLCRSRAHIANGICLMSLQYLLIIVVCDYVL